MNILKSTLLTTALLSSLESEANNNYPNITSQLSNTRVSINNSGTVILPIGPSLLTEQPEEVRL